MGPEIAADDPESRLEALVERFGLAPTAAGQLQSLLRLLVTDPVAPTSVRTPAKVIDDHLADALVALELEEVRVAERIVDIGAGAGLPGLPLAVALPHASVVLVESSARKSAFLERACRECGVSNARPVHSRVESWGEGLGRFDLATARALAPLGVVAEYAAPLLKVGGSMVAWRGARDARGEETATRAAGALGLEPREIRRVYPYPAAEQRHLHLMLKVMETAHRFPRRPGMALKHPLGAA